MANRLVRTIVTAIHGKILILRLAAAVAVAVENERSKTASLNIIRPRAFYYSTRDGSGQEFDFATPEDFRRIQLGSLSVFFVPDPSFFPFFFFFLFETFPYRRGSNRQNYVVAPTKRDISFLAFDGCSSVLCKDRTILFHILEYALLPSPPALFFFSRSSFRDLSFLRCHKFHPCYPTYLYPPWCYAPIYSDILELNLVPATHFEALPRLLWLAHLIRIYPEFRYRDHSVVWVHSATISSCVKQNGWGFQFHHRFGIYNGAFTLFI